MQGCHCPWHLAVGEFRGPQPGILATPTRATPLIKVFIFFFTVPSTGHLDRSPNHYLPRRTAVIPWAFGRPVSVPVLLMQPLIWPLTHSPDRLHWITTEKPAVARHYNSFSRIWREGLLAKLLVFGFFLWIEPSSPKLTRSHPRHFLPGSKTCGHPPFIHCLEPSPLLRIWRHSPFCSSRFSPRKQQHRSWPLYH